MARLTQTKRGKRHWGTEDITNMRIVQVGNRFYLYDIPWVGSSRFRTVGALHSKERRCYWVGTEELANLLVADIKYYQSEEHNKKIKDHGPCGLDTLVDASGTYNGKFCYRIESTDQFSRKRKEQRIQLCYANGFESYWVPISKFYGTKYYKKEMRLGQVLAYGIAMRYFKLHGKYPAGFDYICTECGAKTTAGIRDVCPITRKEH